MNKHLSHLIEISSLDKEIDSFEPRINHIREELIKILEQKEGLHKRVNERKDEIRDCKLNTQKNELHLAELSSKLEEIGKKNSLIKTEKEMKALQLEEEIAKEQITFANEEIARLEKIQEHKREEIARLEEEATALDAKAAQIEASVQDKVSEIQSERQKVFGAKEKLISEMDHKIIAFYEKIRRWAGNSSVVPVRKQACYGCFMRLNDKTFSDVIRSDDIITCPHCGRILYINPEDAAAGPVKRSYVPDVEEADA